MVEKKVKAKQMQNELRWWMILIKRLRGDLVTSKKKGNLLASPAIL